MLDEAYEHAIRCTTEFADAREEDKVMLREISSKRAARGLHDPVSDTVLDQGHQSVLSHRLRPSLAVPQSSPSPASPRPDLQPVNLAFHTP